MLSNEMDRAWQTPRQHWSTMLSKKDKGDTKKRIMKDIGVTNITQELLELRYKVWVLIPVSLTLIVHAAPSINRFKVDPPKPFNGKTLDGTALESWLY